MSLYFVIKVCCFIFELSITVNLLQWNLTIPRHAQKRVENFPPFRRPLLLCFSYRLAYNFIFISTYGKTVPLSSKKGRTHIRFITLRFRTQQFDCILIIYLLLFPFRQFEGFYHFYIPRRCVQRAIGTENNIICTLFIEYALCAVLRH